MTAILKTLPKPKVEVPRNEAWIEALKVALKDAEENGVKGGVLIQDIGDNTVCIQQMGLLNKFEAVGLMQSAILQILQSADA